MWLYFSSLGYVRPIYIVYLSSLFHRLICFQGSGFKPDDSYIGSDYDISLVVQTEGNPVIPCGMAVVSDGSSIICRVQLEAWERYRSENVYINVSTCSTLPTDIASAF